MLGLLQNRRSKGESNEQHLIPPKISVSKADDTLPYSGSEILNSQNHGIGENQQTVDDKNNFSFSTHQSSDVLCKRDETYRNENCSEELINIESIELQLDNEFEQCRTTDSKQMTRENKMFVLDEMKEQQITSYDIENMSNNVTDNKQYKNSNTSHMYEMKIDQIEHFKEQRKCDSESSDQNDDDDCNSVVYCEESESDEGGWVTDEEGQPRIITHRQRHHAQVHPAHLYRQHAPIVEYDIDEDDEQLCWEEIADSDSDLEYIVLKEPLSSNKKFCFPNIVPNAIDDIVCFWELDFQVGSRIIPRMCCWESKGYAPAGSDTVNFEKYTVFKSLYNKWEECNKNLEQWYRKYYGKSLLQIANCKTASQKRKYKSDTGKRPGSETASPREKKKYSLSES